MKTIVSEKGQITIPKKIRDTFGFFPGTVLEIDAEGGKMTGYQYQEIDVVGQWRGRGDLSFGTSVDEYLNGIRG